MMSTAAASSSKPTKQYKKRPDPVSDSESDYSDSSEDVTEDEDGVDLTPALDAAILRTLAKIRNKRGVYEGENVLENELKEAEEKVIEAGIKAMPNRREEIKKYTLADHHRAALLSGRADEDDEEEQPLTHVESQYRLRNEAVSAFKSLADESEEEDAEGGLVKREKEEKEVDLDDEEYRRFLLEMGGGEDEVRKILGIGENPVNTVRIDEDEVEAEEAAPSEVEGKKKKKKVKSEKSREKKAKQDDDFLMDYILNRGWIDRTEERVPTYDEIVGKPKAEVISDDEDAPAKAGEGSHPWGDLDEEDDFDEKAEEFEHAYNFRFEEPGSSNILTHPREIPSLVRRTDDTRATKRAERTERKAAEKAQKEEEARRQKGIKRREMEKQMASLRKDLGIKEGQGTVDWDELEKVMEGDFDEDEWQRVVGKMLESRDDEGEEEEDDNEKPEWDDDVVEMEYEEPEDEEVEMHMTYVPADDAGYPEEEDGPINMDADFDGAEPSSKKRKKNKKGKNKAVEREEVDETEDENLTVAEKAKKVKKAMEEYKALDHEDMIGDMPTRFKYTRSKPTAFGLTPAEILLATDKELDAIAGLRHIAPYRKQGLGMQGRGISKRIYDLKQTLKNRKWGEEMEVDEDGKPRTKSKPRPTDSGWSAKRKADGDGNAEGEEGGSKKKKRLGKKQRQREREANGFVGPDGQPQPAAGSEGKASNRYEGAENAQESSALPAAAAPAAAAAGEAGGGEKEGKTKRRKKKSSQKVEELKIFD